ncbi:helix-turn-helix domain-containing protein [Endozoicomonas euniceicola]|uniref:Helix-turn-helix domain-containing protein n=1 Tax=Endozoicomonas euniceicola TaxID=1234143 RepID=A0ABY6GPW9_9GAMM|nr:helix-turn-helix domain-containing protein [Endozoicomonas euniceicola]UYM14044.1 helix-turn-helix domain-containing protein [Endozoicomonas euniceicola]
MAINYLNAVTADTSLTGVSKSIMVALANRADADGTCFPSIRTIASDTGFHPRTVTNHIQKLKAGNRISVENRTYPGSGFKRSNMYTLLIDTITQKAEEVIDQAADAVTEAVDQMKKVAMPAVDMVKKKFKARNAKKATAKVAENVALVTIRTAIAEFQPLMAEYNNTTEEAEAAIEVLTNYIGYWEEQGNPVKPVDEWVNRFRSHLKKQVPIVLSGGRNKQNRKPRTTVERLTDCNPNQVDWMAGVSMDDNLEQGFIDAPEDKAMIGERF